MTADADVGVGQTLWSWTLHTVCFYPFAPSSFWMYLTYGPSLSGAWALMLMYIWTLIANPSMEFDLAPTVYARPPAISRFHTSSAQLTTEFLSLLLLFSRTSPPAV